MSIAAFVLCEIFAIEVDFRHYSKLTIFFFVTFDMSQTFIKTIQKTGDKGKKTGCEDVYQYWFTALNLQDEDPAYQNITNDTFVSFDKHQKRDTNDCSRSTRVDPLLEVNDEVDCWRPSQPGTDLNKWYRCGNEECIKVFPPADDVDRARNIVGSQYLGGTIALSVSSGMLVIGSVITWWLRKKYYPETIASNRNLTGETIVLQWNNKLKMGIDFLSKV